MVLKKKVDPEKNERKNVDVFLLFDRGQWWDKKQKIIWLKLFIVVSNVAPPSPPKKVEESV